MNKVLLGVAGAMLLIGIALMVLPTPGEPGLECAPDGAPSSGFVDNDQDGCPVTMESYTEYRDWASGPRWDNIAGLVLVVGGLGVGVFSLVTRSRSAT